MNTAAQKRFNPWMPKEAIALAGAMPCGCGKALAEVEKCGRSVCKACARNLNGREMPLRDGKATCQLVIFRTRGIDV